MAEHARAEAARQHLRAQAQAEQRLVLGERNGKPVDLAAQPRLGIISSMGPPNTTTASWPLGSGESLAQGGTADIEVETGVLQQPADASRRRMGLVQDDERLSPPLVFQHDLSSSLLRANTAF